MKLKDLNPDPRNANKGTARGQKMIVSSIQEDGFGRSGLLDKNGQIIAGNKTAEASAEVFGVDTDVIVVETDGKKPVYVKRTDLDLADPDPNNPARRLAYRDNLASRFSFELDAEVVMADIEAGFDFEGIDISVADFGELLPNVDWQGNGQVVEDEPPIDRAAELQEKWGTELGQLWRLGEHRLICGDCTDKAVVERVMGGDKAKAGVIDPPYGVGVEEWDKFNKNELMNFTREWIKTIHPFWDDTFNLMIFFLAQYQYELYELLKGDYQFKQTVIWHYANTIGGGGYRKSSDRKFTSTYQPILIFGDALLAEGNGENRFDVIIEATPQSNFKEGRSHLYQKPLKTIGKLASFAANELEIILDCFSGSGTTLVACEQLYRRCRGIEIDPGYVAVTLERWHTLTDQMPELVI